MLSKEDYIFCYRPCPEGRDFLYYEVEDLEEAWKTCERGDWLIWALRRVAYLTVEDFLRILRQYLQEWDIELSDFAWDYFNRMTSCLDKIDQWEQVQRDLNSVSLDIEGNLGNALYNFTEMDDINDCSLDEGFYYLISIPTNGEYGAAAPLEDNDEYVKNELLRLAHIVREIFNWEDVSKELQ